MRFVVKDGERLAALNRNEFMRLLIGAMNGHPVDLVTHFGVDAQASMIDVTGITPERAKALVAQFMQAP